MTHASYSPRRFSKTQLEVPIYCNFTDGGGELKSGIPTYRSDSS